MCLLERGAGPTPPWRHPQRGSRVRQWLFSQFARGIWRVQDITRQDKTSQGQTVPGHVQNQSRPVPLCCREMAGR